MVIERESYKEVTRQRDKRRFDRRRPTLSSQRLYMQSSSRCRTTTTIMLMFFTLSYSLIYIPIIPLFIAVVTAWQNQHYVLQQKQEYRNRQQHHHHQQQQRQHPFRQIRESILDSHYNEHYTTRLHTKMNHDDDNLFEHALESTTDATATTSDSVLPNESTILLPNQSSVSSSSSSSSSTTTVFTIPSNLRRKVQAKRPILGNVIPDKYKQQQKLLRRQQQFSTKATGGSIPSQLQYQGRTTSQNNQNFQNNNNQNISFIKIMAGIARGRKLESPSTVYLRPMMGKVKEAMYSTLSSFGIYSTNTNNNNNSNNQQQQNMVRHLDIYAGSGSVGLESLSRGASHCTFVDFSIDCCHCIQRNIDLTGLGTSSSTSTSSSSYTNNNNINVVNNNNNNKAKSSYGNTNTRTSLVLCADAMMSLTDPYSIGIPYNDKYQLITICPPYEEVVYGDLLDAVVGSEIVTEDTIIIIEYPIELIQPSKKNNNEINKAATTKVNNNMNMPHVIQSNNNVAIGIRNRKYGRTVIAFYIINPTGRYPDATSRPEEFINPI
jgi:16S rRNA (guanine966-N2)-methyltransferase